MSCKKRKYGMAKWEDLKDYTKSGGIKRIYSIPMGSQRMVMSVGVFQPGEGIPLHCHETMEEIFFIISGKCQMIIGDEAIEADVGTAFSVPPHENRRIYNNSDKECKVLFVGAPPEPNLFSENREYKVR